MKRPQFLFPLLLLLAGIALAKLSSHELLTVFDEPGWKQTKTLSDGIVVFRKPVPGSDLKAIMVSRVEMVQARTVIEVLRDVEHYREFSENSKNLAESRIVAVDSGVITGYECISVFFIQDRHYFFRLREVSDTSKPNQMRIDWELIPTNEDLNRFLREHHLRGKNPMFLGDGAGSWVCENIGEGRTNVSYRLHLAFNGYVPTFAVEFGQRVGVIGFFRDVIKEAKRRDASRQPPTTNH